MEYQRHKEEEVVRVAPSRRAEWDRHRLEEQAGYFESMSPGEFALFVRQRTNDLLSTRTRLSQSRLFPIYEDMDERVLYITLVFEYIYTVLERYPAVQWPIVVGLLHKEVQALMKEAYPAVATFVTELDKKIQQLMEEPTVRDSMEKLQQLIGEGDSEAMYFEFFETIKDVAQRLTTQEEPKQVGEHMLSLEGYCHALDEVEGVRVSLLEDEGIRWMCIDIEAVQGGPAVEQVRLPLLRDVYYKGGASRLLIKLLALRDVEAGSVQYQRIMQTVLAELPFNDYDTCLSVDPDVENLMRITGEKDLAGFDWQKDGFDINKYLRNRDSSINAATLGPDGFYYADIALSSARLGTTMPMKCDQGLFGHDAITLQGLEIGTSRTLERNIKLLVEGKVKSLQVRVADLKMDLGIFVLVSCIRWLKKDKEFGSGERSVALLGRLSLLLAKMGQYRKYRGVMDGHREACPELVEWPDVLVLLDYFSNEYPQVTLQQDFSMHGKLLWLLKKASTRYIKDFKKQFHIQTPLPVTLGPEDKDVIVFDLERSMPDEEDTEIMEVLIATYLKDFLARSSLRNGEIQAQQTVVDPAEYHRILVQGRYWEEGALLNEVVALFQGGCSHQREEKEGGR